MSNFVILPLYAPSRSDRSPAEQSGLNQAFADGRLRDTNEIYIPIPAKVHQINPNVLPKDKTVKFNLLLPNGKKLIVSECQAGEKALMSENNSDLGKYILRDFLKIPNGEVVKRESLTKAKSDSVKIIKLGEGEYELIPEYLGAYEDFKNSRYISKLTTWMKLKIRKNIIENYFNDYLPRDFSKAQYTSPKKENQLIFISSISNTTDKAWSSLSKKNIDFLKLTRNYAVIISCFTNNRNFKFDNNFLNTYIPLLSSSSAGKEFKIYFKENTPFLYIPHKDHVNISDFEITMEHNAISLEIQQHEIMTDDYSSHEGRLKISLHLTYERDKQLPQKKKVLKETGKLKCECCDFHFLETYGDHGENFIECHHLIPVSEIPDGYQTTLNDLALVCSNCHRMIHRSRPWKSVQEIKDLLNQ